MHVSEKVSPRVCPVWAWYGCLVAYGSWGEGVYMTGVLKCMLLVVERTREQGVKQTYRGGAAIFHCV